MKLGGTNTLVFRENDGAGNFSAEKVIRNNSPYGSVVVADIDGDGVEDLFFSTSETGATGFYRGTGTGQFASFRSLATGRSSQRQFEAADLDADGDLDYILMSPTSAYTYLNNGSGTFSITRIFGFQFSPDHLLLGDFNDDGLTDMFYQMNGQHFVRLNQGGANFGPEELLDRAGFGTVESSTLVDWDGDGSDDFVIQEVGGGIYFIDGVVVSGTSVTRVAGEWQSMERTTGRYFVRRASPRLKSSTPRLFAPKPPLSRVAKPFVCSENRSFGALQSSTPPGWDNPGHRRPLRW